MSTITLGRYLWERLHQVGIDTIFGVPGDFNLNFLDYIYEVQGLRWVGNTNELNAAYAADGYARVKGVPGVVVTTHGVGELSALNGIAGAHSEQVKVIHVVGQTTRKMQKERMMIHHSISNDPDHSVYSKMSKLARVDEAELTDIETAPAEIDRVIRECFLQSRPVYIFLPIDLSQEEVPAALLNTPLDVSFPVDTTTQDAAVSAIISALTTATNPAIYIDILTQRHNAAAAARALVEKLRLPVYSSNMGKCIIDESHPLHIGTLNGRHADPGVAAALAASDTVLLLGDLPADTNTGAFTRPLTPAQTLYLDPFAVRLPGGTTYPNVFLAPLLVALTAAIPPTWTPPAPLPTLPTLADTPDHPANHPHRPLPPHSITHARLWPRIAAFLRPNDVVVADTGTATFGLAQTPFPVPNIRFLAQSYYGSIGWSLPATLGASLAQSDTAATKRRTRARDAHVHAGRTLLFVGDGSLLLTLQDLATIIQTRGAAPVIVFVINNGGYTIERVIHGAHAAYNDVAPVDYGKLVAAFGGREDRFWRVGRWEDVEGVLGEVERGVEGGGVGVVEVGMGRLDVPWRLMEIIKSKGEGKAGELREEGFLE